jgi:hypothetical protein
MRAALVITLCVAAVGLLPAPASAKTLTGTTDQQQAVTVRTGAGGVPSFVRVAWVAVGCKPDGAKVTDRAEFKPPFDKATDDVVRAVGTYEQARPGGFEYRATLELAGRRSLVNPANPASEQWTGTLGAAVKVTLRGRVYDTCAVRTAWTAGPAI